MVLSYILQILVLAFACTIAISAIDYTDLEANGMNCPKSVSCQYINPRHNFSSRNCECDRDCYTYDDCCFDARLRRTTLRSRTASHHVCMHYGETPNQGIYAINTCARNFAGPAEVQTKCQNQNNISDPLMSAPVTDISTNTTYVNRYCAECNNIDPAKMQTWLIKMECSKQRVTYPSEAYVWEHITYRPDLNKWGLYLDGEFVIYDLVFDKPEYVAVSRLCRSDIISHCPASFRREEVRRNCEMYTAVVYTNTEHYDAFKNPHCAVCNGVSTDTFFCVNAISSRKKPFSFALLLDVNQSDGEIVGVSRPREEQCGENQKYDPYFRKCRDLVCAINGFKRINGKCQRP